MSKDGVTDAMIDTMLARDRAFRLRVTALNAAAARENELNHLRSFCTGAVMLVACVVAMFVWSVSVAWLPAVLIGGAFRFVWVRVQGRWAGREMARIDKAFPKP